MRPDPARLAAAAQAALAREDWPAAVEALRALVRLSPQAGLRYNLALALRRAGRPGEALAEFDAALKADPRHLKALYERAALLMEAGRPAEALAGFEACLKADPADEDARRNRARLLLALGRWAEAEAAFAPFRDEEGDLARLRLAAEQGRAAEAESLARALMARPERRAAALRTLTGAGRGVLPLRIGRLIPQSRNELDS